jgi:hypothetical protein
LDDSSGHPDIRRRNESQIRKGEESGGLPELLAESEDEIRAIVAISSAFEAMANRITNGRGL